MEHRILSLLSRVGGGPARLDPHAARADLLTDREVASVLAVGAVEARHVVGDHELVRAALADVALTWCRFLGPRVPAEPDAVRVLGAVARGLSFVASEESIRKGLRWLVTSEPFWAMPVTTRARSSP
jgi:hypothetical protein